MNTDPKDLEFRMEPGACFAGKYVVDGVIGTGGMSVVVAAFHPGLRQKVAIKLLAATEALPPNGVSRFLREARAAAALRSEHTARVIDVDLDADGRHFIVMEYLEGEDLDQQLRRESALPIETAVGYVLHVCEAMAEAHALGIIHRDLKPQNVFVTRRMDGTPLVKVLDFGISKVAASDVRQEQGSFVSTHRTLLGTPHYMSPEQIRAPGEIDARSDIWSLGVVLFELLTNREPFCGDTIPDVIASVLQAPAPSPRALRPELPEALAAIVLACLEKDVGRRLANVGVLAQALRPWAPAWARDAATRAERITSARHGSPEQPSSSQADGGAWSLPLPSAQTEQAMSAQSRGAGRQQKNQYRFVVYGVAAGLGLIGWAAFVLSSRDALEVSGEPRSPLALGASSERAPEEAVALVVTSASRTPVSATSVSSPVASSTTAATANPDPQAPSGSMARGPEAPKPAAAKKTTRAGAPATRTRRIPSDPLVGRR